MITICEECGAKYKIDPDKIKGKVVKSKCRACGFMMNITKPEEEPEQIEPTSLYSAEEVAEPSEADRKERVEEAAKTDALKVKRPGRRRLSLRLKMMALFFLIPILMIALSGYLYLRQLDGLARYITQESTLVVTEMAEQAIVKNARSVAAQAKLYLTGHPNMDKEGFNQDPEFVKIGIQKVGQTGYSCLYSIPDPKGQSSLWIHPNQKLIGVNLPETMKKMLGNEYQRWWKVYEGAYHGKESKGYYAWKDADGAIREKYMVCTPIEGSPFVIASTTYLDEFTKPMKNLETRAFELAAETRNLSYMILGSNLLLIGIIVFFYGHRLSGKIKSLTEAADRISVGELGAEIKVTAKDEIGDLAEAIGRMQDSIRIAMERLRRKR